MYLLDYVEYLYNVLKLQGKRRCKVTGTVFRYQVSNRQTMEPSEVEKMVDDTDESWDLTLFTCNIGGKTRCAVRCVK